MMPVMQMTFACVLGIHIAGFSPRARDWRNYEIEDCIHDYRMCSGVDADV